MTNIKRRPQFSSSRVRKTLAQEFGLDAEVQNLPSERDQNFLVIPKNGQRLVLKISNREEKIATLIFQNEILALIKKSDPSLANAVPRLVPGPSSKSIMRIRDGNGREFPCRLFTYLEGDVLARQHINSKKIISDIGQFLAKLDDAMAGYWHPASMRALKWSVFEASEVIRSSMHHITDFERRAIVEYFLASFESHVLPEIWRLPLGVIHNDANDHNILVSRRDNAQLEITGLLDFGDLILGPYINEPAVAAAYVMMDNQEPLELACALLSGYHAIHPLSFIEVELFFYLIGIRAATSVTLSADQRQAVPDNAYLSVSEDSAWDLLAYLISLEPQSATSAFRDACGMPAKEIALTQENILTKRLEHIGPNLSLSYSKHINIVRGFGQYLYDASGRRYLDAVNNVPHVGHCHPKVVAAGQRQMSVLNTNTRYLHENLVRYAERLCQTLPESLQVCYFVCTGSEANELALRLARTHTGYQDIIVIEGAYHGNTTALIDISPYKYDGPGGQGAPEYVHELDMPDGYRGLYKGNDVRVGTQYASQIEEILDKIVQNDRGIAAFIGESLLGCGGQIVLPDGYLPYIYEQVRKYGGVCIADEVQVGFGRVGSHYWAFETQNVIPDIVTLGKPMGNGHPIAAVITTPEIASSFNTGMEYFNTYGGNPVSCAIGMAVLDVIEEENLQENAQIVGQRLQNGLKRLMQKHEVIGDVRGMGLFIGVELVRSRSTIEPAGDVAKAVVNFMRNNGILISTDGSYHNVLKIKPPLVFTAHNADQLVRTLDEALEHVS